MTDHNIRTWRTFKGSWQVTHHREKEDGYLHDVAADFRNFKTREQAEAYAFELFQKCLKDQGYVELSSPDMMGQQTENGCWSHIEDHNWHLMRDDKGRLQVSEHTPEFVLKALGVQAVRQ